jgi:hypothetical protein
MLKFLYTGGNINTLKKSTKSQLEVGNEVSLEVKTEETSVWL